MTKRLVLSVTALVAIVSIALSVPLGTAINNNQKEEFVRSLELSTVSTASIMSSQPYIDWSQTAALTAVQTGARVIVVDSNFNLLLDSELSPLNRPFSRPELINALGGKLSSSIRYSSTLATELRYVAAPIIQNYQVIAVVRLSLPENSVNATVLRSQLGLLGFVLLVIIAAGILSYTISRSIAKPVDQLTKVISDVAMNLSVRANEKTGPAEVRAAAIALNQTVTRLDELLMRTQRVAEEASHHLRSPLTSVRLRLENILETTTDRSVSTDAAAAIGEVDRLTTRINQVLALTKVDSGKSEVVTEPLAEIVRNQIQITEPIWAEKHLTIDTKLIESDVQVSLGAANQIVNELLTNAINYAKSKITIDLEHSNGFANLKVSNDGPGLLPPEDSERIFDRFYRAKNAISGGSGLGLALVRESARQVGGDAQVIPSDTGFVISVLLPLKQSTTAEKV